MTLYLIEDNQEFNVEIVTPDSKNGENNHKNGEDEKDKDLSWVFILFIVLLVIIVIVIIVFIIIKIRKNQVTSDDIEREIKGPTSLID